MVRTFVPSAAALAVVLSGCYDSFTTIDGGGFDTPPRRDGGACHTSAGALVCGTSECPSSACESPIDADLCNRPDAGGAGLCLLDLTTLLSAGTLERGCVISGRAQPTLLNFERGPDYGHCGRDGICDDVIEMGFTRDELACAYSDGTYYGDGLIDPLDCTGLPPPACGPGCASCPPGQACFGSSEVSGLGVCIPLEPSGSIFVSGELNVCGTDARGRLFQCPADTGCLDFVVPPVLPGVLGRCIPLADCSALAAAVPSRFRCNPEG